MATSEGFLRATSGDPFMPTHSARERRTESNRFSIVTSPASSNLVRWLDRLPLVSPVARCRKRKSASVTEERTVRIASRPGS